MGNIREPSSPSEIFYNLMFLNSVCAQCLTPLDTEQTAQTCDLKEVSEFQNGKGPEVKGSLMCHCPRKAQPGASVRHKATLQDGDGGDSHV